MSEPTILTRINDDLKQAMRDRNEVRKLTLRAVKTALTEVTKSGSDGQTLDDEQVMDVLQREAKRRRDTAAEYARLGEPERAERERAELAVLEEYLPAQMSDAEVDALAQSAIDETGATSMKQMGAVMSAAMGRADGRVDGKRVNAAVRRLLTQS